MLITGRTRVFAILAQPVHHVRTPQALHDLFRTHGFDGVVVPVEVGPEEGLATAVAALRAFGNWGGAVVTVPHKAMIAPLCDRLGPRAAAAGAVNVVRRERDGSLTGDLLDGIGFVRGLRDSGVDPVGKKVYLAGAGGAASAIAFALAEAQVSRLTIVNRSRGKSGELIARLRDRFPSVSYAAEGTPAGHDIVVNGTSLGLRDNDPLPVDPEHLDPTMVVAEVIMAPEETALLRAARARGCALVSGKAMLEGQLGEMYGFLTASR